MYAHMAIIGLLLHECIFYIHITYTYVYHGRTVPVTASSTVCIYIGANHCDFLVPTEFAATTAILGKIYGVLLNHLFHAKEENTRVSTDTCPNRL